MDLKYENTKLLALRYKSKMLIELLDDIFKKEE